jgi:hypothetical protein
MSLVRSSVVSLCAGKFQKLHCLRSTARLPKSCQDAHTLPAHRVDSSGVSRGIFLNSYSTCTPPETLQIRISTEFAQTSSVRFRGSPYPRCAQHNGRPSWGQEAHIHGWEREDSRDKETKIDVAAWFTQHAAPFMKLWL